VLIFTVGTTFYNLSALTFTDPAAVIDVRNAVARSMVGVRLRDVGFEGYNITMVSDRTINNFESSRAPGINLVKEHLTVAKSQSSTKVTLNVTVSLTRVGATNGTAAFQSLVSQLDGSYNSGAFLSYTGSSTSSLALATSVTLDPLTTFTVATLLAPDYVVTIPSVSAVKVADVTRSSISLTVILVNNGIGSSDVADGALYCAAYNDGTFPSSTGSVKSACTSPI
jgi:hypothetical protein